MRPRLRFGLKLLESFDATVEDEDEEGGHDEREDKARDEDGAVGGALGAATGGYGDSGGTPSAAKAAGP